MSKSMRTLSSVAISIGSASSSASRMEREFIDSVKEFVIHVVFKNCTAADVHGIEEFASSPFRFIDSKRLGFKHFGWLRASSF